MTPPRGVALIALAMLSIAGCAGTPPRLSWSWPFQRSAATGAPMDPTRRMPSSERTSLEDSNQRITSSWFRAEEPSRANQTPEPVNIWPEARSAWFSHPFSTISNLWIGTAGNSRTALSDAAPKIRASTVTAWAPQATRADSISPSARADDDVRPAEVTVVDQAKAEKPDRRAEKRTDGTTLLYTASEIGVSRPRNTRVSATADEHDDPSSLPPANINANLPGRQVFQNAASSIDDREESLLPAGSLSAIDLPVSSSKQASQSGVEPVTDIRRGAREALRPEASQDDDHAPTSPTRRWAAVPFSEIALDIDSGWACDDDSLASSGSIKATPADSPAPDPDKQSKSPLSSQSSHGPATGSKLESPPARPESASQPVSLKVNAFPASTQSLSPSELAGPQSAPINPGTPLPTTLDETSLMPKSLAPALTLQRAPRQPSDWLADGLAALPQPATAAGSTAVVPPSLPAQPALTLTHAQAPTAQSIPASQSAVLQRYYASVPPAVPTRTHGRLWNWLFHNLSTEPIASSELPAPTFPGSYRSDPQRPQEIHAAPQNDRFENAPIPNGTKKPFAVLSWLHNLNTRRPQIACAQTRCCGESSRCSCCGCCGGNKTAIASPCARATATLEAPIPASKSPQSSGPQPRDVAENRNSTSGAVSKGVDESPQS
jgi:hypothetical protein